MAKITLKKYLEPLNQVLKRKEQQKWFNELEHKAKSGAERFLSAENFDREGFVEDFSRRVRTEELKAWYSAPEGKSLFQGTSISSLTIPYEIPEPLNLGSIEKLEEVIAQAYIQLHDQHASTVKNAILERVDQWLKEGLYYGVVIASKVISQTFDLSISEQDVIFDVGDQKIDPHEILSYPDEIRKLYFEKCKDRVSCFQDLALTQQEFESSLVLGDISKPKLERFKNQIMLAPVKCNEIAALLAENVCDRITDLSSGRIRPRSLCVIIYDTDTPYAYHQVMGYKGQLNPILPGLIVLGCSGTIPAFRWLYAYRTSLIAQKIQKGSLFSEAQRSFMPFIFYGVLVPRDAEILLDMGNLHRLRYLGNLNPELEFSYLMHNVLQTEPPAATSFCWKKFKEGHHNVHDRI